MNYTNLNKVIDKINDIECDKVRGNLTGDKAMDNLFSLAPILNPYKINMKKLAESDCITTHVEKYLDNTINNKEIMSIAKYGWIKYSVCADILEPALTKNVITFAEDLKYSVNKAIKKEYAYQ